MDPTQDPFAGAILGALGSPTENTQTEVMDRVPPTPDQSRSAHVKLWCERIAKAREYWEANAFRQMRQDMKLARGDQWSHADDQHNDDPGRRYVANIILRHIHQRTASIYGKNPKIVARRKKRLLSSVWDGNMQSAAQAMMKLEQFSSVGLPPPPDVVQLISEVQRVTSQTKMLDRVAETLELVFDHEIDEQPVPFKVQLKATIRRTLTTGVGWVKIGFQRVMKLPPEIEQQVQDMSQKLALIERITADLADGEVNTDSPEADQLRSTMQSLKDTHEFIVREGLALSYPDSTAILPDPETKQLRGFVGAAWVAEQYFLSADRIKEVYGVDVGRGARAYSVDPATNQFRSDAAPDPSRTDKPSENTMFCVWEIYSKTDGLVYVVCDGWPDFLVEPGPPDVWLERFYPWFSFVTNEVYDEKTVFPPSDVRLIQDMQLELNRARQGLREHRRAARPMTIARAGTLEDTDKENINAAKAHEIVELKGLPDNMRVEDALMPWSGPQIDPNLYNTNAAYEDVLRVVGVQEANLGATSGATATESSIAEGSRISAVSSIIDDLDEFLGEMARAAGQILLAEMSPQIVKRIVGQGAVWPELSRDDIAREIYLDIEAASTGRPNKAAEVQNAQLVFPLLMQIPGMSPEWMARELLRRLDDRLDLTDAFAAGMPSIQAMNGAKQMAPAGENDPNSQGDEGGNNAPSTKPAQVNAAPRPGRPPMAGALARPGAPGAPGPAPTAA